MKRYILFILLSISICGYAQETTSATWNASFEKNVVVAHINGIRYENITVQIESSEQGYTTTYTSGWLAGSSSVKYPWVKIKMFDSDNKKIYSKKLKRSCLFIFNSGKTMQIGQPDNVTTEAIMKKYDDGWYMEFDEKGDL